MMGTGSGANWINGVHSTCGAGKLTGSIDNLISPGRRCQRRFLFYVIKYVVTKVRLFLYTTAHQVRE
ncbi:hypothetical protein DOW34_15155 [Salmonella enterica subsp. enterica serovar Java]|uniref:Uncharacterized protein n=3 Tax=Salmonella enterica I TaxID=59201 RepID=A0A3Z5ZG08_SALEB|nr:hypothetical protein LFZ43_08795 [Salmonella enterica subsp. enterica serovar Wandsworth str. SA20092095]EAA1345206.1 hypothetical protein [Salmonella enterica subsp. enterica serovar Java]EAA3276983.1 hypothetical protein [Salmonella enterica subsp. enterica serovar Brunei]EAA3296034.1 hypothetical protein [Salmonella enterica subsp. enterica serovar Paratyphi B]EAA4372600.1 hypothetical protein [Salmonella enterica subsp. enterica serovar Abony]EAA4746299.1 hypothetical protein [Salmonell